MTIYAFAGSLTRPAPNYGEANGRGITSFAFDDAKGALTFIAETVIEDASWLEIDPERHALYAVCEIPGSHQSALSAFSIDHASGTLTLLSTQPTGGQTACHTAITPDGGHIAVANYNAEVPAGHPDGAVRIFPLLKNGDIGQGVSSTLHQGSGPNADRQRRAHAHCVLPSPDGRFLYTADLGIDLIKVYALSEKGELASRPASDFRVSPGLGPRHLALNAEGTRLFMVSELIPTVMSFNVDRETGALSELDSFSIERLAHSIVQPAGIILGASDNFLFASLRECNEILGLSIDRATGKLSQTGRWSCGGKTPRDLTLSPSGKHLLVANQDSDEISIFETDPKTGTLGPMTQQFRTGSPMAIKLASFPGS